MIPALGMAWGQRGQEEENDRLAMSAVGVAVESTLCAWQAFAITRLGSAAMCLFHPSPHFLIKFIFSLLRRIFYDRSFLCEMRWVKNKIS